MFSLAYADEVVVEEVDVEAGLEDAGEDLRPAVEVVHVEPVDPVQDVEETVQTESRHVVRSDVLYQTDFVEHDDLWDKCDGFQPETVAPHEFPGSPSAVDDQRQHKSSRQ